MQINVLEYLEHSVQSVPDKIAFADGDCDLTFSQFSERTKKIGSCLLKMGAAKEPVIVYMRKSTETLTAFFGTIYAGCYYVPVDEEMPARRIELILENANAGFLIYDDSTSPRIDELNFKGQAIHYNECMKTDINQEKLDNVRKAALDIDPIYVLFTSGSTGIPKGVVGHHKGVIDYIDGLTEVLNINEESVFGNQTPFYVDACMKEVYSTLKCGSTTYIIPKQYFMFPIKLVEFLNEKKINTLCWVVSAFTMISAFGTFDEVVPKYLKTVSFGSEVFPVKQFNIWKKTLPDVEFYNLYGPTEATGVCCYYHADRLFEENEAIPIGRPFHNTEIMLLDEEGRPVKDGDEGEICIHGTCLTHGYHANPERTNEVFVQNPFNKCYHDLIYKTGDLGYVNERGELVYTSRKDYQIKHMGHRIELGEIEADVNILDGIRSCCCVFVKEVNKIVLFYDGDIEKRQLTILLKERLPRHMIPNAIIKLDALPLTQNGKMDRIRMKEMYLEQSKSKKLSH